MRLFIALPLPEDTSEKILSLFLPFKKQESIKLVPKENLHITLVFLGDIDETLIPAILESIKDAATQHKKFTLKTKKDILKTKSSIIALTTTFPLSLRKLQEEIKKELKLNSIPFKESPFTPHLTIAKIKKAVPNSTKAKIRNSFKKLIETNKITFDAQTIVLYESRLTPKGPVYTIISYENFGN